MKVKVTDSVCQGHAMCILACPDWFILDDITGHARVVDETVPPQFEDAVAKASQSCPEGAIEITA
jgi:ferredoxin